MVGGEKAKIECNHTAISTERTDYLEKVFFGLSCMEAYANMDPTIEDQPYSLYFDELDELVADLLVKSRISYKTYVRTCNLIDAGYELGRINNIHRDYLLKKLARANIKEPNY